MTILSCLKTSGACLTYGHEWLVIVNRMFRVYEETERGSYILIQTSDEEKAVEELMR